MIGDRDALRRGFEGFVDAVAVSVQRIGLVIQREIGMEKGRAYSSALV